MPQLIASIQGVEVKHVFLQKDRTTLGRKPGNDIVLDTMVVSGQHCAFDLVGVADVYLQDLGSTNGTYVNDRMVKQRIRLNDGDVIAIGPYRIKYLQASEAPSSFGSTTAFHADAQLLHNAAPQPRKTLWYNAGHNLTQQAVFDSHDWLVEHIGLDPRL